MRWDRSLPPLVLPKAGVPGTYKQVPLKKAELYHVTGDISEATDVADKNPFQNYCLPGIFLRVAVAQAFFDLRGELHASGFGALLEIGG